MRVDGQPALVGRRRGQVLVVGRPHREAVGARCEVERRGPGPVVDGAADVDRRDPAVAVASGCRRCSRWPGSPRSRSCAGRSRRSSGPASSVAVPEKVILSAGLHRHGRHRERRGHLDRLGDRDGRGDGGGVDASSRASRCGGRPGRWCRSRWRCPARRPRAAGSRRRTRSRWWRR